MGTVNRLRQIIAILVQHVIFMTPVLILSTFISQLLSIISNNFLDDITVFPCIGKALPIFFHLWEPVCPDFVCRW